MLLGLALSAGVALHAHPAAGQTVQHAQLTSPTYAIPLRDGNNAIVWWDAVSDPGRPGWRCEVSPTRGEGSDRTITTLSAAPGDWRAALAEARTLLKGRLAGGE